MMYLQLSFLIQPNGTAAASLAAANAPGVLGYRPYIHGPSWYNDDLSINKTIPIRERIHATIQGEFLNITNHPTFNLGNLSPVPNAGGGVLGTNFGQQTGTGPSTARRIEFRANIEF